MVTLTRDYQLYIDEDQGYATDDGGGYVIPELEEDMAIALFRQWFHRQRAAAARDRLAECRRARLHLVTVGKRDGGA
jgi:hypothetical protein